MPHKVQMIETRHEITNRDVIFSVKKGRKKIGELRVSKGNLLEYRPIFAKAGCKF